MILPAVAALVVAVVAGAAVVVVAVLLLWSLLLDYLVVMAVISAAGIPTIMAVAMIIGSVLTRTVTIVIGVPERCTVTLYQRRSWASARVHASPFSSHGSKLPRASRSPSCPNLNCSWTQNVRIEVQGKRESHHYTFELQKLSHAFENRASFARDCCTGRKFLTYLLKQQVKADQRGCHRHILPSRSLCRGGGHRRRLTSG